jgi:hypothetical protein
VVNKSHRLIAPLADGLEWGVRQQIVSGQGLTFRVFAFLVDNRMKHNVSLNLNMACTRRRN